MLFFLKAGSIKALVQSVYAEKGEKRTEKSLGFYEFKKLFRGKTFVIAIILVIFKLITLTESHRKGII